MRAKQSEGEETRHGDKSKPPTVCDSCIQGGCENVIFTISKYYEYSTLNQSVKRVK